MISEGRDYITTQWWLPTFPGLAILLAVTGSNCWGMGCATCWIRDCGEGDNAARHRDAVHRRVS